MSTTYTTTANLTDAVEAEKAYDEVLDDWHAAGRPVELTEVRGYNAAHDAFLAAVANLTDDERQVWLSDEFFNAHRRVAR